MSVVGVYFKIFSGPVHRPPCFTRCLVRVHADSDEYFLLESKKPVTTRNPEWSTCFALRKDPVKISRQDYVTIMASFKDQGLYTVLEGNPSWSAGMGPRSIHNARDLADKDQEETSNRLSLFDKMKRLAEAENITDVKLELLLEDANIIRQWPQIVEGANLLKNKKMEEADEEWCRKQTLKIWQAQMLRVIETESKCPNDRIVHWVYDEVGNTGKTWLAKFAYRMRPTKTAWVHNGATKDIMKLLSDRASDLEVVFFDLSRCNLERINWDAIERIKNGMIMSTKYDVKSYIIDPPVLVCFANFEPDLEKLSIDRWRVWQLNNGYLYSRPVIDRKMDDPKKWADPDGLSFFGMPVAVETKMAELKCQTIPPAKGRPKAPPKPKVSPTSPVGFVNGEYRCDACCDKFRKGLTPRPLMECFACRNVNKQIEKAKAEIEEVEDYID